MTTRTNIRFAPRMSTVKTSPTLVVLNKANELISRGIHVIDFGPGEPDFRTPAIVAEAAKKAIDDGFTKYTNALGCNELRIDIAESHNRRYGTSLKREHVIAGTGGKQELFNLALALVSDGDEVIIPAPYWVSFPDQVLFAGGKPVFVSTEMSNGFRPTLELIRSGVSEKTRGVILNSPNNPTGAVIEEKELAAIASFCNERGLFLVFDETYEVFVYNDRKHVSAVKYFEQYPETVVVVNSMSKTYAMTGWRLGFAIAHPSIINALGIIQSHSTSNPSSISQYAAIEALRSAEADVLKMKEAYLERQSWIVPALNDIPGFECAPPDGAFYVFPRVSSLYGKHGIHDSASLANYFLEEARVAVVPGAAFGADDYIRISYATSIEAIREGVRRLKDSVSKLLG